jgi:uncharacterized membrane protein
MISKETTTLLKKIITASIFMGMLDTFYLGTTKDSWNRLLIKIQGSELKVRPISTFLVYVSMLFGLTMFVLKDFKKDDSLKNAVFRAGMLGFVIFSVYELTNYAIIDNWEIKYVFMDSIWGTVLFSLTALFTLYTLRVLRAL